MIEDARCELQRRGMHRGTYRELRMTAPSRPVEASHSSSLRSPTSKSQSSP